MVYIMSSVLSIRIRKELKTMMKKVNIDWRREIEDFIENRIKEYEKEKALNDINKILKDTTISDKAAWEDIREDREGD